MTNLKVKKFFSEVILWLKERVRKVLVSLKRSPQMIPLVMLTVSFLIFSLNLTDISNTTAYIQGAHMGLAAFVSMLFSILSYVCLFSAFPKRQKPNWLMVALVMVLYVIVIVSDLHYLNRITMALTNPENPVIITEQTQYVYNTQYYISIHVVAVIITMVTVALEPLFAKLFKKINTSIEVEDNGELDAIDISDED